MDLEKLNRLRPFVYHLTSANSIPSISESGFLRSACSLAADHGSVDKLLSKRRDSLIFPNATIRDQAPLYEQNIEFAEGFSMTNFLELLNAHVYFWPGNGKCPTDYGQRHFERYKSEKPLVLRIPLLDLVAENRPSRPLLCRFNSGSPRCSGGKKSPRTPNTFEAIGLFKGTPSQVVEIVYRDEAKLPPSTQVGSGLRGGWQQLR